MQKTILSLLIIAPFMLIDACSSARLTKRETSNDKVATHKPATQAPGESVTTSASDRDKKIVIRYKEDAQDYEISTRFEPTIKDHYRHNNICTHTFVEQ